MKRTAIITTLALGLVGVMLGLLREAKTLNSKGANMALGVIFVFLAIEFLAHLLGSRAWRSHRGDPDRAAYATLSSLAIWIAILTLVPTLISFLGTKPNSIFGIVIILAAVGGGMKLRLWFMREIYELEMSRAASLWLASRITMFIMAAGMIAVVSAMQYAAGGEVVLLSLGQ